MPTHTPPFAAETRRALDHLALTKQRDGRVPGLAAGVDLVADQRPDPAAAASESTDAPGSGDADSGGAGSGDTASDDPGQPPSAG